MTVSVGVAMGARGETEEALLARADAALYRSRTAAATASRWTADEPSSGLLGAAA